MRNPGKFKLRQHQTCMSEGPGGPPKDRKRLIAIERLKIQCTKYCNSGLSFSKLANRGLELIMVAHVTSLQAAAVTKTLCRCLRLSKLLSTTFRERRRTSGPATMRGPRFACSCRARRSRITLYDDELFVTNRVKAHVPITIRNLFN